MEIVTLNHQDPAVQKQVRAYLAPDEAHNLFILGNLGSPRPARMVVATENGRWRGIAAVYETFRSFIPFAHDEGVVRCLVRHVLAARPVIEYLNGVDYVAAPAFAEMLALGYQPASDPHQVFMELDGQPPPQAAEHCCRLMQPEDAAAVVRVLRALRSEDPDINGPVTDAELGRVRANPDRWVAVHDGQVVATAATSGLGIRACQIIGVATHPHYRRQGWARAVCAHLVRQMAHRGATHTVLFTPVSNVAAQACYAGMGFKITGKYYVARFKTEAERT